MQEHESPQDTTQDLAPESEAAKAPSAIEPTGQAAVDAVLQSLEGLDDLPVADHVEVFDRAHDGLRRALDEAGREQTTGQD